MSNPIWLVRIRFGGIQRFIFGRTPVENAKKSAHQLRGRSLLALVLPEALLVETTGQEPELAAAGFVEARVTTEKKMALERSQAWMESVVFRMGQGDLILDVSCVKLPSEQIQPEHFCDLVHQGEKQKFHRFESLFEQWEQKTRGFRCPRCGSFWIPQAPGQSHCAQCESEIALGRNAIHNLKHVWWCFKNEALCLKTEDPTDTSWRSVSGQCLKACNAWSIPRWPSSAGSAPKDFDDLARLAQGQNGQYSGEAEGADGSPAEGNPGRHLALLKLDVDRLGEAFSEAQKIGSEARDKLSHRLHIFFTEELPGALKKEIPAWVGSGTWKNQLQWIYPLFSGGDDLVLVGPAMLMAPVAITIHKSFMEKIGNQNNLTLRAAWVRFDPKEPLPQVQLLAERLLKKAKEQGGNRLAVSDLDQEKGHLEGVFPWDMLDETFTNGVGIFLRTPSRDLPQTLLYKYLGYLKEAADYQPGSEKNLSWSYRFPYTMSRHRSTIKTHSEALDLMASWLPINLKEICERAKEKELALAAWTVMLTLYARKSHKEA